uniref:Acetyltransferase n=1 Tax=Globodera pallida TaxID=36090 RepID=A0A183BV44_GLOPA
MHCRFFPYQIKRHELEHVRKLIVPKSLNDPQMRKPAGAKYAHSYQPGQLVHAYTLGQPAYWGCGLERFSFWTAGVALGCVKREVHKREIMVTAGARHAGIHSTETEIWAF